MTGQFVLFRYYHHFHVTSRNVCDSLVEKPSLQSRHSLDSSKVQEKDKEAGPLWITLALQKQKGFRDQQLSREERKTQREAKLAEKQARERDSVCVNM